MDSKNVRTCRTSSQRLDSLEKSKTELGSSPQDSTLIIQKLTPKQLDFSTPTLQKRESSALSPVSITTPSSGVLSDVESIASGDTSTSVTPDFSKMSLGRGRGRPRKPVKAPQTNDYPVGGSKEEIDRYVKKKTTELWRFKKLSSSQSAEYRAAENKQVKEYNRKKRNRRSVSPVKVTNTRNS